VKLWPEVIHARSLEDEQGLVRPTREPGLRCPGEGALLPDVIAGCLSDHDYLSPYRTVRHGESAGTQLGGYRRSPHWRTVSDPTYGPFVIMSNPWLHRRQCQRCSQLPSKSQSGHLRQ